MYWSAAHPEHALWFLLEFESGMPLVFSIAMVSGRLGMEPRETICPRLTVEG